MEGKGVGTGSPMLSASWLLQGPQPKSVVEEWRGALKTLLAVRPLPVVHLLITLPQASVISQDMLGKNAVRVQEQREPLNWVLPRHGIFLHIKSFNSHSNCQLSCHQHSVINEEAEA